MKENIAYLFVVGMVLNKAWMYNGEWNRHGLGFSGTQRAFRRKRQTLKNIWEKYSEDVVIQTQLSFHPPVPIP